MLEEQRSHTLDPTTMATTAKATGLKKLLEDQLADIYYAEKKVSSALKKMAKSAEDKELSTVFLDHQKETEGQIARLEDAFEALGKPAKGKKCEAIEGLLKEATEIMEEFKGDPALDAALIGAAQKVEHYEIGSYGSIIAWAKELGEKKVAEILHETLVEEKKADKALTELAKSRLNAAGDAHRASNTNGKSKSTEKASSAKTPAMA